MTKKKNVAILLAGGTGNRFSGKLPKQFAKISGRTILEHAIDRFETHPDIDEIILVINAGYKDQYKQIIANNSYRKVVKLVEGGVSRQESSKNGVFACDPKYTRNVIIQEVARPFLPTEIIDEVIKKLKKYKSIDVAIPSVDTLIKVNNKSIITEIPDRSQFMCGQMPQAFDFKVILKAHKMADRDKLRNITDDCGLVLRYNLAETFVVHGSEEYLRKITYPLDLDIANRIYQLQTIKKIPDINIRNLRSKNVLLFGHSSGIGLEIFNICKKELTNIEGYSRSNGGDIRDYKKINKIIKKFVSKFGKIDILISTVGVLYKKNLLDQTSEEIDEQITINYSSQINLVKQSLPFMAKNSSIALFSSGQYIRGRGMCSVYSSSKAAIANFVQALSEEIEDRNIKINAISPARTHTPLRTKNFGIEPMETLLDPKIVAISTLKVCMSNLTGQVVDIRKND